MKAYLISPDHQNHRCDLTVVDVAQNAADDVKLENVYELLGCGAVQAVAPRADSVLAGHALLVDENGLLKQHPGYLFMPKIFPAPLAGKILVLAYGRNAQSETVLTSPKVSESVLPPLLKCAYCSPAFARAAAEMHENTVRKSAPDAIVFPASQYIRPQG